MPGRFLPSSHRNCAAPRGSRAADMSISEIAKLRFGQRGTPNVIALLLARYAVICVRIDVGRSGRNVFFQLTHANCRRTEAA